MNRWMLGLCAGFVAGYTLVRCAEASHDLRAPAGTLPKDARAYGTTRRACMVAGVVRSLAGHAVAAYLLPEYLPAGLRKSERPLVTAAYTALGTLVDTVLETPVDYVERYVIDRRYGLTEQSPSDWLRDRGKMAAVSTVLGTAVTAGLLSFAKRFPKRWPLISTAAGPPLLMFMTLVTPIYIAPLFNQFEPLRGTLETRLRALAQRYGVGDAEIVRFDMSKQTKKANAYVAGLLGTHRIAVADTLLGGFTDDEIEFVVAHELGHYVARDTWIGVAAGSLAIAFLLNVGAAMAGGSKNVLTSIGGFARFSFGTQLLMTAIAPLMAAGSRAIERRADRFALSATHQPQWGIAAFERLREQNLAEDEQPRWAELLVSTHPPLRERISALRETT